MHPDVQAAFDRATEPCNGSALLSFVASAVYRAMPADARWSKGRITRELMANLRTTKSNYGPIVHGLTPVRR